ncbi:MAG: hypothetical protein HY296_03180 [Thaumarchaeota archaeon]|nr:hypothetical protein [Nitrososphaerota archaeon]
MGKPSGYDALAAGNIWQNRVAEAWAAEGYEVQVGWGHNQPDIVLPIAEVVPPAVVSVKTFFLVPSSQRYGPEGKHSYASGRTIYRREVIAEINYALTNGAYMLILTVINQRNGVAEHVLLNPKTFQAYATSQRLNDDSGDTELVIWDLDTPVWLEENKELGWERITNPHFDSEGQQIDYD